MAGHRKTASEKDRERQAELSGERTSKHEYTFTRHMLKNIGMTFTSSDSDHALALQLRRTVGNPVWIK